MSKGFKFPKASKIIFRKYKEEKEKIKQDKKNGKKRK